MARTSVLLAMQFPSLLFWHFLVSSTVLVMFVLAVFTAAYTAACGWNPDIWFLIKLWLILCMLHGSDYALRLYIQKCLIHQPPPDELDRSGNPVRIKCLLLWSMWELRALAVGLALAPLDAVMDLFRSVITGCMANLIVDRPNFSQFGELADSVYCSYCASLYLERVREERRRRRRLSHAVRDHNPREDVSQEYIMECPCHCVCCLMFQFALPLIAGCFLRSLEMSLPFVGGNNTTYFIGRNYTEEGFSSR